ncbi:hypothetical protein I317_00672 [Kwoniella heveanensis CBS 569]|nr:hypothetical protein I317_00672 [Kwoniella heveanensis CBS 569]
MEAISAARTTVARTAQRFWEMRNDPINGTGGSLKQSRLELGQSLKERDELLSRVTHGMENDIADLASGVRRAGTNGTRAAALRYTDPVHRTADSELDTILSTAGTASAQLQAEYRASQRC